MDQQFVAGPDRVHEVSSFPRDGSQGKDAAGREKGAPNSSSAITERHARGL